MILSPGLASLVQQDSAPGQPYPFDLNQKIGWTKGEFYFQRMPLSEVFSDIGRQFDIIIKIEAKIENLTFTGRIALSDKYAALDLVCLSSGLNYRKVDDSTFIIYE